VTVEPGQPMTPHSRIDFNGESVAEAIAQFNECSPTQLTVPTDPAAQMVTIRGQFQFNDPEHFSRSVHFLLDKPEQAGKRK
jgi:hypothetical protein